jgi:glyoxylase-like metal-dependent hydrolase (beta-lactamase superfamily II)
MKFFNFEHQLRVNTIWAVVFSFLFGSVFVTAANSEEKPQKLHRTVVVQPQIDRFTVDGDGAVNTYWITTAQGLIVVDFQRDTESAGKAIAKIQAVGKPVIAMLLTHAHPDHIGGIDQFKRAFPVAPLYATQATLNEVKNDTTGYQKMSPKFLQDKAPRAYPLPDRILKNRDRIVIGGVVIQVSELGKGESASATLFYLPQIGALFSGDVIANKMTDFLLEKGTGKWLKQIDRASQLYPQAKTIYPGHGAPGNPNQLIKEQRVNLQFVRDQVKAQIANGQWNGNELTDEGARAVAQATQARFPGYLPVAPLPGLLELNAKAVASELKKQ